MTGKSQMAIPDTVTFSDFIYQPSEKTQVHELPDGRTEPNVGTSLTCDMQPGEIRAVISGRAKRTLKLPSERR